MRSSRLLVYLLIGTLALAAYLTLRGFDVLGAPGAAQVRAVPPGHQEIAFLVPASGGDTWERLVAAVDAMQADWPRGYPQGPQLHVRKDKAFVELTADVAELALWLDGGEGARLWLRWYKLSSENSAEKWIAKLAQRSPPPLAVVGGDISDRALALAEAMQAARGKWHGADPLLLLTTATADHYKLGEQPNLDSEDTAPRLIRIYQDRSFRFSFTNKQMARVVLDFVQTHPDLWPDHSRETATAAGTVAAIEPWTALSLAATGEQARRHVLHTFHWEDDSYSVDLARRFTKVFQRLFPGGRGERNPIAYSAGDYFHPNPPEAFAINPLVAGAAAAPEERRLLALPTAAVRAQRLLRTLVRRDPLEGRHLVVVTGDSISFNNVYRDRNVSWNILDVPVPLVLFAHRNPVSEIAGFRTEEQVQELRRSTSLPDEKVEASCSGTDDVLLNRDLLMTVLQAAYRFDNRRLLADADQVRDRFSKAVWHRGHVHIPPWPRFAGSPDDPGGTDGRLFDVDGDRRARTGEHVVWLNPSAGGAPLVNPTITVWRQQANGAGYRWKPAREPLHVRYNWTADQQ